MDFKHFLGFDMAKKNFVVNVYNSDFLVEIENSKKEIKKRIKKIEKELDCSLTECLCCFEHTGLYSVHLMEVLSDYKIPFVVVSGTAIKAFKKTIRGKDDFIDAKAIAEFCFLKKDKLKLYIMPCLEIRKMKHLLSLRAQHVKNRASYITRHKEQLRILDKKEHKIIFQSQKKLIKVLDKEIESTEKQILEIINANREIKRVYNLLISIKGIGFIVATNLIVKTKCFKAFENWRQFSCYSGSAPFPKQSGKMDYGKRISKFADQEMKKNLTLAARSAMLYDPDIKGFSMNKNALGKSKKWITNAVRNKLLSRVFAVIKRGTPYIKIDRYAYQ